jgi:diguanylate cyclase (GGDEF)-like protein/hemerythrin-like metal-binding protein/PAS domain S-box-containing protein
MISADESPRYQDGVAGGAVLPIADVLVWDRQFETGIPEIDMQHRKLVQLINALGRILAEQIEAESLVRALLAVLGELADYVAYHFSFEEQLMGRFHCDLEHETAHKQAHADFIRQLGAARESAATRPVEMSGEMLFFLTKWLLTHIVGTDMRMVKNIQAIQSGLSEQEAAREADAFMSNATEAMLQVMYRLYDNLAQRTRDLLEVKHRLDREIEVRRLREEDLRKLSRAVEDSPVSIIITDARGEFEYVNPRFTEITGYALDELRGKTPRILSSGKTSAAVYEDLWATISAGGEWHGEMQNRKKNGELYWDYAAISPVFGPQGEITHFVSIQEEITARKQAEDQVLQQKQFSEEIINSLPGIFYMLNPAGRFARVNPQFLEVSGYTQHELEQMSVLNFFEGGDQQLIAERMQEVFATGDAYAEAEFIVKSGLRIPYYFTGHRTVIDGQPYLVGLGTDVTKRRELEQELVRQARTDGLTGLANRRYFLEQAEQELVRARRYDKPLSVLMLDLDEFKVINDAHGHQVGDEVLRTVSAVCRQVLRGVDIVGRMGGEEFAILLPETDTAQAGEVAERLRQNIASAGIALGQGGLLGVTASIGVATFAAGDVDVDKVLNLADKAMYEAKRKGRNQVCTLSGA